MAIVEQFTPGVRGESNASLLKAVFDRQLVPVADGVGFLLLLRFLWAIIPSTLHRLLNPSVGPSPP